MHATISRAVNRALAMAAVSALAATLAVGTAHSEENDLADIQITVDVEDRTYLMGELIPIDVTVTNTGTAVAEGVLGSAFTNTPGAYFAVEQHTWGEFGGQGVPIGPGETVELRLLGGVYGVGIGGDIPVRFGFHPSNEGDPADNEQEITVRLVPDSVTGDVSGHVFGDLDGDGSFDTGEGLGGVEIVFFASGSHHTTLTDSGGHFLIEDLPSRSYSLSFSRVPDGWILPFIEALNVDGSAGRTEVDIEAHRPLTDVLSAGIDFTADSYRAGEVATMRLTLTNSGRDDLTGIRADCDRMHSPSNVVLGPEWTELIDPGVTIPAGRTRTFELTATVPDAAAVIGDAHISCAFGNDERLSAGFPAAEDHARVLGMVADGLTRFWEDRNGSGFPDDGEYVHRLRVGLIDTFSNRVAARATTGADGRAVFEDVPTGRYLVRPYGPWRLAADQREHLFVHACGEMCSYDIYFEVERPRS